MKKRWRRKKKNWMDKLFSFLSKKLRGRGCQIGEDVNFRNRKLGRIPIR